VLNSSTSHVRRLVHSCIDTKTHTVTAYLGGKDRMDFIERLFHVSPDGGNGLTELLYLVAISAVGVGIIFRRRIVPVIRRALRVIK
jgi:hypothetical protein